MKKLMIVIAACAMAVVAKAATVTWTGNIPVNTGITSGYYAVLIDASGYDTIGDAITAIMTDGASASGVMYSGNGTYNSSKGIVAVAQANKALPSSYQNEKTYSYWSIMFDGSVGSEGTAAYYYNMTATSTDVDAAGSGTISSAGKLTVQLGAVTNGAWTPVPEPTSGILMLLGFAGLALRRRRA